jgi:hypothetical protein
MFMLKSTHDGIVKAQEAKIEAALNRSDSLKDQLNQIGKYKIIAPLELASLRNRASKYDKIRADENSRDRAKRAAKAGRQVAK